MKAMKCTAEIMRGNLDEAKKYAEKALEMRDVDKNLADWMRSMVNQHLDFNNTGAKIMERHMEELKAETDHQDYNAGMVAVWKMLYDQMANEASGIRQMMDATK